ncbi:MAG: hypothetical protein EOP05_23290, partial [Proteobacteria bacterium]
MAVGAGAAVAGEGALAFAEGAAAANARLQLGLLGVDMAASGINLVSSCPPSKTYTNIPAKCSIQDALSIVERGPSRAECYSAAGETLLAVAPAALSAAVATKRALTATSTASELGTATKEVGRGARAADRAAEQAPMRSMALVEGAEPLSAEEVKQLKYSADNVATRLIGPPSTLSGKDQMVQGLAKARIKSLLAKHTQGDLHSSDLIEREAANKVANDLSQSVVDQLARQGIRARRERTIVNASVLKKTISKRQAQV